MGISFADVSVLLVDDDFVALAHYRTLLDSLGIEEVVSAENGAQAKAALSEHSPSLILLDIHLPDASGIELLSFFQEQDPAIPVVMVTADGASETVVECMRRGAYDLPGETDSAQPIPGQRPQRLGARLLAAGDSTLLE